MKRNTIGEYARQIVSGLSFLWSAHLSAHKTSAHHDNRIGGAEQAQGSPAGASQTQEHSGTPTTDQRAALNTWEDEGGSTAAPEKRLRQ